MIVSLGVPVGGRLIHVLRGLASCRVVRWGGGRALLLRHPLLSLRRNSPAQGAIGAHSIKKKFKKKWGDGVEVEPDAGEEGEGGIDA